MLTVLAIAGAPVLALIVMAVVGAATPLGAAIAIGVTLLVALALALLWARDLDVLSDTVRRLGEDQPAAEMPVLPGLERVGRETERLSRRLADRSALMERLRRADEAIVERLPDPLIVLAADRSVRRANSAAQVAFGADMAAVLRHPGLRGAIDRAFTQPEAARAAPDQVRSDQSRSDQVPSAQGVSTSAASALGPTQAGSQGTSIGMVHTAEITLSAPVARELLATVVPMDPPLADGGRAVVVLSDRTRERAVERMRADFIANASHELRTPLASLMGFIDTLRGPAADDPPAQQRFLGIMAEQAARMNRLIDDLLSLSRIELTEHQAPAGRVELVALLHDVIAGFEPRLTERGVTLDVTLTDALPPVLGDADQLLQVAQNLLDNAVKYGRDGEVVRLAAEPASGPRWPARPGVVLTVADRGPGIPREHLPRLTERFYRVDAGRSRAVGGTGLGLAIVKHIVNRHRGQLAIESEPGVGTTVTVWLPVA
jgi:two-component system, OmpR family, phosphate regulon sensor histidine kinase PhoR